MGLILAFMGIICATSLKAQGARQGMFKVQLTPGDTICLAGSVWLLPGTDSLVAASGTVPRSDYTLLPDQGCFLLSDTAAHRGVAYLYVRYLPQTGRTRISLRQLRDTTDTSDSDEEEPIDLVYEESIQQESRVFWGESGGIRKTGSLTRGITVGNNRSASFTSGLRLQLEGDLGDDLRIIGAITDENIPIQPDGNTQQLSDFDRVFIQLQKKNTAITLGDFEVEQKHTRFANFYRNVQGVGLGWEQGGTKLSVSGAVAKGKFHTNSFMGQEGIAGPYRLAGRNGERFLIILAGSEKVYLNGGLMKRGESEDYVINYNTGEITFTPKHLITSVSRIVVDFEYNDRFYNRSLLVVQGSQRLLEDRVKIGFSFARDADNPNAPFENEEAFFSIRDTLASLGDADGLATTSGIFAVGWNEEEVRYEQRDTLVNGQTYTYYRRSTDPELAIYQLQFSLVQDGSGFYENDPTENQPVFQWVGPDITGQGKGRYAPVRTWVLPQQLQVADATVDVQISPKIRLLHETALSGRDLNRLSGLNDEDNLGIASRTALQARELTLGDSLTLSVQASQQLVQARYANLDRIYRAEYNRRWNLPLNEHPADEQILESSLQLRYKRRLELEVEGGLRFTGPGRTASRQIYTVRSQMPKLLQGYFTLTRLQYGDDLRDYQSEWNRYEGDIFAKLGPLQPGIVIWAEQKSTTETGEAQTGTFSFVDFKPYLKTTNTLKWGMEASLNYRNEKELVAGSLRNKAIGYTAYLQTRFNPAPWIRFLQTSAFRDFRVQDTLFKAQGLQDTRVLNTNIQTTLSPKKRWVYLNTLYEVNSEQLARREVRYIQVNPGQGQYVWLDSLFNNDGIQDVEEFQLANNPLIADFIRVLVPTQELVPTTRLSLSGTLRWDFKPLWKEKKGMLKALRAVRLLSSFRLTQSKSRNTELGSYFINLRTPFADTTLLNANYSLRQDLILFQNSPKGDLRFYLQDNQNKLFLNTGDEFRGFRAWGAAQRLNLGPSRSIEAETRIGRRFTEALAFPTRNYDIQLVETQPKLNIQLSRKVRISGGYAYNWRQNQDSSGTVDATVRIHKALFDTRWNLKDRNNVFLKLELSRLRLIGAPNFSAGYELQEGLQAGLNAIWQAFVTFYVLDNVELSLTYDGRVSEITRPIHTGRVQLRAFF